MLELLCFAKDLTLGGKFQKTVLAILAVFLWHVFGLWGMLIIISGVILTLFIASMILIIGFMIIVSNNKD